MGKKSWRKCNYCIGYYELGLKACPVCGRLKSKVARSWASKYY